MGRQSLWLAGDISVYLRTLGVVYIVMGGFYIMICKWLPWERSIVRKWGEWRGGDYLIPIFPFLFNKTKATEELFSKGGVGIL